MPPAAAPALTLTCIFVREGLYLYITGLITAVMCVKVVRLEDTYFPQIKCLIAYKEVWCIQQGAQLQGATSSMNDPINVYSDLRPVVVLHESDWTLFWLPPCPLLTGPSPALAFQHRSAAGREDGD
jgi:hypothetical protein